MERESKRPSTEISLFSLHAAGFSSTRSILTCSGAVPTSHDVRAHEAAETQKKPRRPRRRRPKPGTLRTTTRPLRAFPSRVEFDNPRALVTVPDEGLRRPPLRKAFLCA